ncbi:unnamed protein product [Phytomonas sp. EM1]|nr:unnamed protein product [Phytomonas sp. EM1]|eukprot:CCW65330.1 unnamed protein product [Phytomonas sp. isolate EM1]
MQHSSYPRGRSELLRWLNNLCNFEYPAVESLRDGASYCTIIEATVKRIANNCSSFSLADADRMTARASRASALLSRVDLSITAIVCENIDPSLDTASVRNACRNNMTIFQEMLRECVPPKHKFEIDVDRLAMGKLQDHVKLLQWLYQFMSKVLAQYSKSALEKRIHQEPGKVEGVKLNRSIILLEQKRLEKEASDLRRGNRRPSQSSEIRGASTSNNVVEPKEQISNDPASFSIGKDSAVPSSEAQELPAPGKKIVHAATDVRYAAQEDAPPVGSRVAGSSSRKPCSTSRPHSETRKRNTAPSPFYQTGSVLIPESLKQLLSSLRHEVESLEGVVMQAHENHYSNLTRRRSPIRGLEEMQDEPKTAPPTNIPSLQELGELLEERDVLAQQLAGTDAVVQRFCRKGVPTPLLAGLCSILYPSTVESEE